jgi:VWFA-related protein
MLRNAVLALVTILTPQLAGTQPGLSTPQEPSFKSGVELVTVSAVVKDHQGRPVSGLTAKDFNLMDGGQHRTIVDCHIEQGPITVAVLADVSGSMAVSSRLAEVRATVRHLLSWLNDGEDQVALFAFDDQLHEIQSFTTEHDEVNKRLDSLHSYGTTSLYDAVWQTGAELAGRVGTRSAVVVITDGVDNASRLSAAQAARVVRVVDVPVYVIGVDPSTHTDHAGEPVADSLTSLARATGGEFFATSASPAHTSLAVRQIVSELRHRYLIAFEPASPAGWHSLAVRTTNEKLVVRARSGYLAGAHRERT